MKHTTMGTRAFQIWKEKIESQLADAGTTGSDAPSRMNQAPARKKQWHAQGLRRRTPTRLIRRMPRSVGVC